MARAPILPRVTEELNPETRRELRLQRIEDTLKALRSDFDDFREEVKVQNAAFRAEVKERQDKQDRRQERILWAVIGLILTIAGGIMTAAVSGILPN